MKCVATRLSRTLREAFSLGRGRNLSPVRTARYGVRRRYRARVAAESCGTDVPRAYVALSLRLRRLVPALVAPVAVDAGDPACGRERADADGRRAGPAGGAARGRAAGLGSGAAPRTLPGRAAGRARVAGAPAGRPARCRSAGRCANAWVSAWRPASRTPTARPTASWPPCCPVPGRWGSGSRLTAAATPSRPIGWGSPSARCRPRCATASLPGPARRPPATSSTGSSTAPRGARCRRTRATAVRSCGSTPRRALGAGRLPRLVAHEAYPGHHLECSRGEAAVAAGRVELGVSLLGSPQTVVSEGLAECGLGTAVGPGWGPWAAGVLADVGVSLDGRLAERLDPLLAVLRRVRVDAALLLHDGGAPTSERIAAAEEHLRRWLLLDAARARRVVGLARPAAVAGARRGLRGGGGDRRQVARAGARPRHATPSAARRPGRSECAAQPNEYSA